MFLSCTMDYHDCLLPDCGPGPCVHGTCSNTLTSFNCKCHTGYTGLKCDQGTENYKLTHHNYKPERCQPQK